MQPRAFSAKVRIQFPHLLHYAGTSTTSRVASSSETVLAESGHLPPQSPDKWFPPFQRGPPPHSGHLWEEEKMRSRDRSWAGGAWMPVLQQGRPS